MNLPSDAEFMKRWGKMKPEQKRFIMARQYTNTIADAAREAEISTHTAYGYGDDVRGLIDSLADHRASVVCETLDLAAVQAVQTLVDLLDSDLDTVRARVAEYIIDQASGKATQKIEQETTQVESIEVEVINGADE